jgi:hypothetical protein
MWAKDIQHPAAPEDVVGGVFRAVTDHELACDSAMY